MVKESLRQQGFSLLEIMVVLVIIGIGSAMMGLGMGAIGTTSGDLRTDARRLAQLFPIAQAEARTRGQPIVWEFDETGYSFRYLPRTLVLPLDMAMYGPIGREGAVGSGALRPRAWSARGGVRVRIEPASARRFDGEWMPGHMVLALSNGQATVVIERQGDGRYEVLR